MERRNFLQMIGVATAVPVLPVLPRTAPVYAAPTAVQYAWAAQYARVHNTASPARLVAALKVSPQVAQTLMTRLMANGVLSAPLASGVAQAINPLPRSPQMSAFGQSLWATAERGMDSISVSQPEQSEGQLPEPPDTPI